MRDPIKNTCGAFCLGLGLVGAWMDGLGLPAAAWAAGYAGLATLCLVITNERP